MDHLYLIISGNNKKVLAKKDFKRDDLLLEFKGEKITTDNLPADYEDQFYMQIDHDLFIGPSGDLDDHIKHSCEPNTGVIIKDDRAFLITLKPIKQDEEITWDYSTTANQDNWEIECTCNSLDCRKTIKSFKYLPEGLQERYIELGIVPDYARG